MPGLKRELIGFRKGPGNKVTPDEIDSYKQYCIIKPSASTTYVGTVNPGTVAGTFVLDQARLDYPRNVLFSVTGPAGGAGGTATVSGKNQFGVLGTETITIASANGGGTTAGSLVFAEITLASYDPNGGDNTGTPALGVAIGTAATDVEAKFGIPDKLGGTADIKAVTWIDNGTAKTHDAAAAADTTYHAFVPAQAVAAADDYIILYKPSKNLENESNQANL